MIHLLTNKIPQHMFCVFEGGHMAKRSFLKTWGDYSITTQITTKEFETGALPANTVSTGQNARLLFCVGCLYPIIFHSVTHVVLSYRIWNGKVNDKKSGSVYG